MLQAAAQNLRQAHSRPGQTQRRMMAHSCPAGALHLEEHAPGARAAPRRTLRYSNGHPTHSSLADQPGACSRSADNRHREKTRTR